MTTKKGGKYPPPYQYCELPKGYTPGYNEKREITLTKTNKMSYKKVTIKNNSVKVNQSTDGEPLEVKLERILESKEPIPSSVPLMYAERNAGVNPATDIRTDRFETAIEATTMQAKTYQTRRQELAKGRQKPEDGKPESIQGTAKT